MTKPCTTKTTATNAKCAKSCAGECNTAETGSRPGSLASAKPAAQLMRRRSEQTALNSGQQETGEDRATGGESFDQTVMRWVLAALVIGWLSAAIVGLKGCTA